MRRIIITFAALACLAVAAPAAMADHARQGGNRGHQQHGGYGFQHPAAHQHFAPPSCFPHNAHGGYYGRSPYQSRYGNYYNPSSSFGLYGRNFGLRFNF